MRQTIRVPTLSTLFMMVIMGVYWYMPPKASQLSALQQGSRLSAVWTVSRTTGRQVL